MMMGTVLLLKTCTYMDHDLNVAKVLEGHCLFVTCVNDDATLDLLDICVRAKACIDNCKLGNRKSGDDCYIDLISYYFLSYISNQTAANKEQFPPVFEASYSGETTGLWTTGNL